MELATALKDRIILTQKIFREIKLVSVIKSE